MDGPINSLSFSPPIRIFFARWPLPVAFILLTLCVTLVRGEAMTSLSVEKTDDLKPLVTPTPTSVPKINPSEPRITPATPPVAAATVAPPVIPPTAAPIVPKVASVPTSATPVVIAPIPTTLPAPASAAPTVAAITPSPATINPAPAPDTTTTPVVPVPPPTATTVSPLESMPIRNTHLDSAPANTTQDNKNPTHSPWGGLFASAQVFGALAIVLGLIFGGKALLRRFVPGAAVGSGKGVLEILARYPLGKNQSLVLLRLGSQLVLISQGKESSQSLLVVSNPQEVANILGQVQGSRPDSIQSGFSNLLATASKELEQTPVADSPDEPNDAEELFARGTAGARLTTNRPMSVSTNLGKNLDEELDEMAAARRQLMDLRQKVTAVRQRLPG
ncbi:MAG: flagellar biosynthetic protein FliO [Phycisphaerae bacterium]